MIQTKHIAALWQRMTDLYPNRWGPAVGTYDENSPPCRAWFNLLSDLAPEQIAQGLRALERTGDAWPPSAPQFRKLCVASSEMPSENAAYTEAVRAACLEAGKYWERHAWTHAVVYEAARHCGTYQLSHMPDHVMRNIFRDEYRRACARWNAGDRFNVPVPINRRLTQEKRVKRVTRAGKGAIRELYKHFKKAPAL